MITENEVGEIRSRHARHESVSAIARDMGLSRPTVRRYLKLTDSEAKQMMSRQSLKRASKLLKYKDDISDAFTSTDGNCVNVLEVLKTLHPEATVSLRTLQWFCKKNDFRRGLENSRAAKHTKRIETDPGFEVQIDFGEKDVFIDNVRTRVHFFVAVLGFSRMMHAEFYLSENYEGWARGLERAFLKFGGVPRHVVCDNAKALVYAPAHDDKPAKYNERFKSLCQYWGTKPEACNPHNPEEKGKVERTVFYIKDSFLKNFRKFKSVADIQEKFELWNEHMAATRAMKTADGLVFTPKARLVVEKTKLIPISKPALMDYELTSRKVSAGGYITVDNSQYQLAAEYANKSVEVMHDSSLIVVTYNGATVCRLDKTADTADSMPRMLKPNSDIDWEPELVAGQYTDNAFGRDLAVYGEAAA